MKKKLLSIIFFLFYLNVESQCGQYIENKISRFSQVRFWDENNGLVIGGSSLLSTHDGGTSWETYELPHYEALFYNPLNHIEIIGSSKAFVFGADGIVLYTDDKGITWQRKVLMKGLENFRAADFISDTIGYAVGINNYQINDTAFIYKTIDGGETWFKLTSNISSLNYRDFNPHGVEFIDEDNGFSWGGRKFYRTTDGGVTWFEINNPSSSFINKIQIIDAQTIYMSSGDFIYKSIDGGENWTNTNYYVEWTTGAFTVQDDYLYYSSYVVNGIKKVSIQGGTPQSAIIRQDGYLTDINFINNSTGFAVGKKRQGKPNMGRFIYKTIDGGTSWVQLDSGSPLEGNSNNATFFKKVGQNKYIYSTLGASGSYTGYSILQSNDNGASWKEVKEVDGVLGWTLYANDNYISDIRYANPSNSAAGYIFSESFDDGMTWQDSPTISTSIDLDFNRFAQSSVDNLYAYQFLGSELYHSIDNGLTWTEISTPDNIVSQVYKFIDENVIVLFGANSTTSEPVIYRSTNGGISWDFIVQITGVEYDLTSLDYVEYDNVDNFYLYSNNPGGKLYIYNNTDKTLIAQDIPFYINRIRAIDSDSIMIQDNSGNIYISHDYGASWSQRFWANYANSYPNIYVEDEDNIFLWEYNFIQNLKKYVPSKPDLIFGKTTVAVNTQQEYIIPVDLFSSTEWSLSSGGSLIVDPNSYYKVKVNWETEGDHIISVRRTNDCGSSEFMEIQVTVSGTLNIDENELQDLSIYPNPFNNKLYINLPENHAESNLEVTLYNVLGQKVYQNELTVSDKIIELKNLSQLNSSGIYFLKVESANISTTHKLIRK